MRLLIRWGILALAVFLASSLLAGVDIKKGLGPLLLVSAVLGLTNALLGTFLRIVSIPLLIVTLGLFSIVINMVVLWVTTLLTESLQIDGFWNYLWASLIISIVTIVLKLAMPNRRRV